MGKEDEEMDGDHEKAKIRRLDRLNSGRGGWGGGGGRWIAEKGEEGGTGGDSSRKTDIPYYLRCREGCGSWTQGYAEAS
ncbi:hypothetical protein Tco_0222186 [Tanacetum coccineum]